MRLSEHYRQMSDGELLILLRQKSELTDLAQQALQQEISRRDLKLTQNAAVKTRPEPPPNPVYDEDRQPVEIATVWSLSDALQLQWLLDRAGIPFFMGDEKATGVDTVTSDFGQGISVKVMSIAIPWVQGVMQAYEPKDDRTPKAEEMGEAPMRCPKCHSEEVVLEQMVPDVDGREEARYEWTCDACGYQWVDDGIVEPG